jgi:hypothetical protein
LVAAFYIEGYLSHALPAVGAGYLAQEIGLLAVANVFGAALILLACAAIFLALAQRRDLSRRKRSA